MGAPSSSRARGRPWPLLALLLFCAGCGDDPAGPTGSVSGFLVEFSGGAPLAGARVMLLDPRTNAISAVQSTDAEGHYRIDGVRPGRYYAAASFGRFIVFETRDEALEVVAGRVIRQDFRLGDYPYFDPDLPAVSGRVFDGATGLPLAGAYVSVGDTDLSALFSGIATPWEVLTDDQGHFTLPVVPFFVDSRSGALLGLYPVMAMHPGYAPAATGSIWRREFLPLPFPPGASTIVDLRLRPNPPGGVLRGSVEHEGRGVPGVPVGLALVDTALVSGTAPMAAGGRRAALEPALMMADLVVRTDSEGVFEISGIPGGRYRIHAAYWPDDGWVMHPGEGGPDAGLVTVTPGSVATLRIPVLPGLVIIQPLSGSSVPTGRPLLAWGDFPGADLYRVRFGNADSYLLTNARFTEETSMVGPLGLWGDGDWVRWAVEAYHGEKLVALSDVIATFVVRSRGGPGL